MCWNYNIILNNISCQFSIWIVVIKRWQYVSNCDSETLKLQSWEDIKTLFIRIKLSFLKKNSWTEGLEAVCSRNDLNSNISFFTIQRKTVQ